MLITNFSAGELAETLFGRVDLGQYYNGVSHLENFDVIPTGGISRRHGFKRIAVKNSAGSSIPLGEGRIIPFILNRDESFLLFLSPKTGPSYPAMIRVFDRDGVQQGEVAVSTPNVPLYETMKEINEVQYAQNYDKMVLVHENYAPILVTFDEVIKIDKFLITYYVPLKSSIEGDNTMKEDEETAEKYFPDRERNYPRAVTFFNNRLMFAGTKNFNQRIFVSRVNDINNFSTYTLFRSEVKEYETIIGQVNPDNHNQILINQSALPNLKKSFKEYYIDSVLFDDPNTKIQRYNGTLIEFTDPVTVLEPLSLTEKDLVNKAIKEFSDYNKRSEDGNNIEYQIGTMCNLWIGSSKAFVHRVQSYGARNWELPDTAQFIIEENPNYLNEYIDNIIKVFEADLSTTVVKNESQINEVVTIWKQRIRETMKFTVTRNDIDYPFYGFPQSILSQLEQFLPETMDVYIPIYTKTSVEDKYPTPDDGFTFELASDMSDSIKWLAQSKNLLVGTETGEWVIPAGVNATNVQAVLNSRYGSDKIQATAIGDAMCFFQSGKKALVEYYIPQQDNNFRANNMAMLSKNMLHESPAFDFDFISAPYTKIFVSRENGTMVCLLYERSTGTFAWGRITTGKEIEVEKNGVKVKTRNRLIRSVATVPGLSGYDDVYLLVQQGDSFHLERYSERVRGLRDDDEEAVFLDSYQRYTGNRAGYFNDAVVYDETDNKVYPYTQAPIPGHVMWIGYPYESRVRSMPVLANDQMKQNNIKNLHIRFNDSFMPRVRSVSMSEGKERLGNTDSIGRPEPYSGVVQVPFPGVWDRDVFFELVHDKPTRCRVLAVNAEAN